MIEGGLVPVMSFCLTSFTFGVVIPNNDPSLEVFALTSTIFSGVSIFRTEEDLVLQNRIPGAISAVLPYHHGAVLTQQQHWRPHLHSQ